MNSIIISNKYLDLVKSITKKYNPERWIFYIAVILGITSTVIMFKSGYIIAYGDAESHLNIAKRVVGGLTPGFAQLGGIWLPLPHIFLTPFVYFDWLWRTGLAGSIISGIAFVISSLYIFKLTVLLTRNSAASFVASLVFMLNPNILYLQSTPMTELPLIVFFVLSTYYFIRFLHDDRNILMLVLAALFGFAASLSRYDGWGLVLMEAGVLFLYYFPFRLQFTKIIKLKIEMQSILSRSLVTFKERWDMFEGRVIIFSSLAFFGIFLWLLWDFLILGDPLYFTHSRFSANSQQLSWLARGELPAYQNFGVSVLYYFITSIESVGTLLSIFAIFGAFIFLKNKTITQRWFMFLILFVPFIFNTITLYLGQSVIFLPGLTPPTFEWTLFNVRYGSMMLPFFALFIGYLFYSSRILGKTLIIVAITFQSALFAIGFTPVLALDDGVKGLSSAITQIPDAQPWITNNYDYGLVLTDDFARTVSIIRSRIPMENIIYIGNRPYWEESLVAPEKYARWIVMQKNDDVWRNILDIPERNARLFKYFNKVYTSEEILIFRRIDE